MPKGILHIVGFLLILDSLPKSHSPALVAKQIAIFY